MLCSCVSVALRHGNAGRESYYHGFFNSLAASPGSIITPAVGSSLPFILLSFLLPPELPTKSAGEPRGRVWCFQTLCVPGGLPQERVSVNPLAGGEPHTQRGKLPSQATQLSGGRTGIKCGFDQLAFVPSDAALRAGSESPSQHPGSSLTSQGGSGAPISPPFISRL